MFLTVLVAASVPGSVASRATPADSCQVTVEAGMVVQGQCGGGVASFRGIPYGAPPIGNLRWQPPQNPSPWSGALNTTAFRRGCKDEEDCLCVIRYLNVWTPEVAPTTVPTEAQPLLPVMVFIHGGCWKYGNVSKYDGSDLVAFRKDIVVVTLEYRMSVFGFLGGDAVAENNRFDNSSGNFGIQDQRKALQWVQDHIKAFSGDPSKVLLFGQSAGGASVANHLVRKQSWGLFSAAAMESGSLGDLWASSTTEAANAKLKEVHELAGCLTYDCLVKRSFASLNFMVGNPLIGVKPQCRWHTDWEPSVDGVELTDLVWRLAQKGQFAAVPVVVGYNRDEGASNVTLAGPPCDGTIEAYEKWAKKQWGYQNDSVLPYYNLADIPGRGTCNSAFGAASAENTDSSFRCPSIQSTRWLTANRPATSGGVYFYTFQHEYSGEPQYGGVPWVVHGAEIPFVFHQTETFDPASTQLADVMSTYWANFAATGNPNNAGQSNTAQAVPEWPTYSGDGGKILRIVDADNITAVTDLELDPNNVKRCGYWDDVLPYTAECSAVGTWKTFC